MLGLGGTDSKEKCFLLPVTSKEQVVKGLGLVSFFVFLRFQEWESV